MIGFDRCAVACLLLCCSLCGDGAASRHAFASLRVPSAAGESQSGGSRVDSGPSSVFGRRSSGAALAPQQIQGEEWVMDRVDFTGQSTATAAATAAAAAEGLRSPMSAGATFGSALSGGGTHVAPPEWADLIGRPVSSADFTRRTGAPLLSRPGDVVRRMRCNLQTRVLGRAGSAAGDCFGCAVVMSRFVSMPVSLCRRAYVVVCVHCCFC